MFHQAFVKGHVLLFFLALNPDCIRSQKATKCPGVYCGRVLESSPQNLSDCKACPRGYRTDGYICQKCNSSLSLYDCLYLGFMALLIPVINCHFINYFEPKKSLVGFLHLTTVVEAVASAFISLLVMEPYGKLSLNACRTSSLKDWYTVFYNPKPDFVHKIHCTQEAVYPLFTIVFVYIASSLIMMVIMRPVMTYFLKGVTGRQSIYASMYLLPIITTIHAVFSGLIYYSFPYLILVSSSVGSAIYLSVKAENLWNLWKNTESVLILLTYCLANAYGIVSITLLSDPVTHGVLLLLIFLPILFYYLTYGLIDPSKFT